MGYQKNFFLLNMLIAITIVTTVKPTEPWSLVNNTRMDVYIRVRCGEVGPDTEMVIPGGDSLESISEEIFKFPKESIFSINLDTLQKWPIRIRVWKAIKGGYVPTGDVNAEGKPLETSSKNMSNTWSGLISDKNSFKKKFPLGMVLEIDSENTLKFIPLKTTDMRSFTGYVHGGFLVPRGYIGRPKGYGPGNILSLHKKVIIRNETSHFITIIPGMGSSLLDSKAFTINPNEVGYLEIEQVNPYTRIFVTITHSKNNKTKTYIVDGDWLKINALSIKYEAGDFIFEKEYK